MNHTGGGCSITSEIEANVGYLSTTWQGGYMNCGFGVLQVTYTLIGVLTNCLVFNEQANAWQTTVTANFAKCQLVDESFNITCV